MEAVRRIYAYDSHKCKCATGVSYWVRPTKGRLVYAEWRSAVLIQSREVGLIDHVLTYNVRRL